MDANFVYELIGNDYAAALVIALLPLVFVVIYALVAILGELKIASWIQERLGPMRTGWKGVMQPVAEVVKLLQKEDITPDAADKPLFNLAPYIMFAGAFAGFAVIPFSSAFAPAVIDLGLFYIFAISSLGVIGLVMGGWASNNKYSLLGAMRSAAQIVSYEIPAAMTLLTLATLAGTLNLQEFVQEQSGGFWNWFIFGGPGGWEKILIIPFMVALFILYLVSSLAETNRTPFDIPEGESEIVAGYHTEYSGMKFAMFFFAEYANMFIVSAIIAIAFFGGWNSPIPGFLEGPVWGLMWFLLKALFFVFVSIWLRWTLPRLRVDQLMYVSWKVMTPAAFLCFFVVGLYALLT